MTSLIGVHPLGPKVLVDIYDDGSKPMRIGGKVFWTPPDDTFGPNDIRHNTIKDHAHSGKRPRWAVVVGTNEESEAVGIRCGQKVLLNTLEWSRGVKYRKGHRDKVWSIPHTEILGIDHDGFDEDDLLILSGRYPEVG